MDHTPSPRPKGYASSEEYRQKYEIVRQLLVLEGRSFAQIDKDVSDAVNCVVQALYDVETPPRPEIVAAKTVYHAAWELVLECGGMRSPWQTTRETPGPDDTSGEYRRYYEQEQATSRGRKDVFNRLRSLFAPPAPSRKRKPSPAQDGSLLRRDAFSTRAVPEGKAAPVVPSPVQGGSLLHRNPFLTRAVPEDKAAPVVPSPVQGDRVLDRNFSSTRNKAAAPVVPSPVQGDRVLGRDLFSTSNKAAAPIVPSPVQGDKVIGGIFPERDFADSRAVKDSTSAPVQPVPPGLRALLGLPPLAGPNVAPPAPPPEPSMEEILKQFDKSLDDRRAAENRRAADARAREVASPVASPTKADVRGTD